MPKFAPVEQIIPEADIVPLTGRVGAEIRKWEAPIKSSGVQF